MRVVDVEAMDDVSVIRKKDVEKHESDIYLEEERSR